MTYTARLARQAERSLERLPRDTQAHLVARLAQLATDPYTLSKRLQDPFGRRSSRVGGWRIIFRLDEAERVVEVSDIGPRGQVYRRL